MTRCRPAASAVLLLAFATAGCSTPADPGPATYYVSADGDDTASGRSPDEAWASLARVTDHDLAPGETVVLGGERPLTGSLRITSGDAGAPESPVRITAEESFPGIIGEGQAGVDIVDTSGVEVSGVRITAADPMAGTNGVLVTVSPGGGAQAGITLRDLRIDDTYQGIAVGTAEAGDTISDVTIDQVHVTGAVRNGILTYGPTAPDVGLRDLRILNSVVTGTRGLTEEETNTGSGIVVGSVEGALLKGNTAAHNGAESDAPEGPIGIWTHDSRDVTIRDNIAHHNRTRWTDGGGFGVDISSTDVLVERNLSHDNDGAGYLLYTRAGALPSGRVTFRYNASVHDARQEHFPASFAILGGLDTADPGVRVHDVHVHHNTVITAGQPGTTALLLMGTVVDARIHHNLLDARAVDAPALRVMSVDMQGTSEFRGNQLLSTGGVLELDGQVVSEETALGEVFRESAGNVTAWSEFVDPGDLPRGLRVIDPQTAPPVEGAGGEQDLLGTAVDAGNEVIGAVSG